MNKKGKAIEIRPSNSFFYPDRLYWISDSEPPKNINQSFYFNIDNVQYTLLRIYNMMHSIKILDLLILLKLIGMYLNLINFSKTLNSHPMLYTILQMMILLKLLMLLT
jgi:hypothetical protein